MPKLNRVFGLACLVTCATAGRSEASFTGFGTGAGFSLNGDAIGSPTIGNGVLTLTNGLGSEARSSFYTTPQAVARFTAQFTYQDVGGGGADGAAFVIQNGPAGAAAVGAGGASFGYGGLPQGAAVFLGLFSPTSGTGLGINGSTPATVPPSAGFTTTGAVALNGGDPIQATLGYDGTTLTETLVDLTTSARFATSYAVNLPALVGSTTAYVGFTGGTGAFTATQQVSGVSFTTAVPEPAAVALVGVAGAVASGRRRRVGR